MAFKKLKTYLSDLFDFIGFKGKLFVSLSFLLIISIVFSIFIPDRQNFSNNIKFEYSKEEHITEDILTEEKKEKKYAYGVSFPDYNIRKIDKEVRKQNKTIIDDFVSKYKKYDGGKNKRAVMTANYSEYRFNKFISVVRNVTYKIPNEETKTIKYGLFVSADDKKTLNYKKVFSEDFKEFFTKYSHKYLKDKHHLASGDIDTLLKNKNAFSEFVFINENVIFFIRSKDGTLYEVPIETKDISEYLNSDLFSKEVMATIPAKAPANTIDPDKPMIALTFDDGPKAVYTKRILNTLKKYNARATFFVLGSSVQGNEDCIRLADEIGCEIGNHTFNHDNLIAGSVEKAKQTLEKTSDVIKNITNKRTNLVRPPFGNINIDLQKKLNYSFIMWSVDTEDWITNNTSNIVSNILSDVYDGSIVLMHDIYPSTADAVEIAIPQLIDKGYQLVTVSELLEYKNANKTNGNIYYSSYDISTVKESNDTTKTEPKS